MKRKNKQKIKKAANEQRTAILAEKATILYARIGKINGKNLLDVYEFYRKKYDSQR